MALTGERDYQSSVLWFLDKSSAGNAPGTLSQATAERLVSSAISFVTAYGSALIATTADEEKVQSAATLWKSSIAYGNEATVNHLIGIVGQVGGMVNDVLSKPDDTQYRAAAGALKNLIVEIIDVADAVRDDNLTKAVLDLSKPYSEKLKEVKIQGQKEAAEHAVR
jgi:hypothetical protein